MPRRPASCAGAGSRRRTAARDHEFRWASVTKLLTGFAVLVAVEEGTVDLDEPAGPPASTLRHLLAHASGLGPEEGPALMPPERRRIYSNYGIELAAALVSERAEMPFAEYLRQAVLDPLGLAGSPAQLAGLGLPRPARRRARLRARAAEPRRSSRPRRSRRRRRCSSPASPASSRAGGGWSRTTGGSPSSCATRRRRTGPGSLASPRTFGHFGAAGAFLWVDPDAGVACAVLTDREFGDWAKEAWPRFSDAVLAEATA